MQTNEEIPAAPVQGEGTTFGDLNSAPAPAASDEAIPEASAEAGTAAATDGGTTPPEEEPEVPGILKEPQDEGKAESEDRPGSETVDAEFQKHLDAHPIIKARWEAEIAKRDRGVDKFIQEHNTKLAEANARLEGFERGFAEIQSGDPVRAWKEIDGLIANLEKTYGAYPGWQGAGTSTSSDDGEPKSKYGLEFPTDDKIVDVVLQAFDRKLDERLGPIAEDHKARTAEKETLSKADTALPRIQELYEVSSDRWVTQEMVAESIREYPGLAPEKAFAAHKAREIALYLSRHQPGSGKTVRNLPANDAGGKTRQALKEGATFGEINASEAVFS